MVEIIGLLARESNLTIRPLTAADFGREPDQLVDFFRHLLIVTRSYNSIEYPKNPTFSF
jgi:hypothetical protein